MYDVLARQLQQNVVYFSSVNIADEIKSTTDFELDLTDGVKILKEDGWVIIRPSGTEPIFRCFAESDSQQKAGEMTEWGISLIKKYKK